MKPAGLRPADDKITLGLLDLLFLETALSGVERNSDSSDQSILPELRTIAGIMALWFHDLSSWLRLR